MNHTLLPMKGVGPWIARHRPGACLLAGLLLSALAWPVLGQSRLHLGAQARPIENLLRPRVALAPDGAFAVAAEVFVTETPGGIGEWQIVVQIYASDGSPVGPANLFEPEDGSTVSWENDYLENAEIAFLPDGTLLVLMEHEGRIVPDLGGGTEVTVGAVSAEGQIIDLHDSGQKVQQTLFLPSSTARAFTERRPRLSVSPQGELLVALEASSQSSHLRYAALKAFDTSLAEAVEQFIPHDDPGSEQAFHIFPDVATNGALVLAAWQECPVVDNQGNADDCDIGAQFIADELIGGNVRVNDGDAPGTLNLWPAVAMDASGRSVVAWADARTGPQGDIFAQRFAADGQRVGGNLQVSAGGGFLQDRPEVAMHDDGGFMVVWEDSSFTGFRARGRMFDASGAPLGPPFLLMDDQTWATAAPDVSSDGISYLYTWAGYRDGEFDIFSNRFGSLTATASEDVAEAPTDFRLLPNYPNPFNPTTTLAYELPQATPVRLSVYDMHGREVARLVDSVQPAGRHQVTFEAGELASGVYFYRIEAGRFRAVRRLVLLK